MEEAFEQTPSTLLVHKTPGLHKAEASSAAALAAHSDEEIHKNVPSALDSRRGPSAAAKKKGCVDLHSMHPSVAECQEKTTCNKVTVAMKKHCRQLV